MKEIIFQMKIREFAVAELSKEDQLLVTRAREAMQTAYAPYSKFKVGAALVLSNGEIITASNQENAAYPSGMCAERVALFYAQARYPDAEICSLAVCSSGGEHIVSPCGACRQVMVEYERRGGKSIRLLMCGDTQVMEVESSRDLLPLSFEL